MKKVRRFAGAFALATLVAVGILSSSTPAYAGTRGYCQRLQAAIDYATSTGQVALAAYLQSLYNTYCS